MKQDLKGVNEGKSANQTESIYFRNSKWPILSSLIILNVILGIINFVKSNDLLSVLVIHIFLSALYLLKTTSNFVSSIEINVINNSTEIIKWRYFYRRRVSIQFLNLKLRYRLASPGIFGGENTLLFYEGNTLVAKVISNQGGWGNESVEMLISKMQELKFLAMAKL